MSGYAGGTAASDILRLRRMVGDTAAAPAYGDDVLRAVIARYPLPDSAGEWPYLTSGSVNTDWTPTYDLASAAADVWGEKAGALGDNFDFTADGATFHKEQQLRNYERQERKWRSRRQPGNHAMIAYPMPTLREVWIGNLAEDDD